MKKLFALAVMLVCIASCTPDENDAQLQELEKTTPQTGYKCPPPSVPNPNN